MDQEEEIEQNLSNEQLNVLVDLLEKLPPLSLSRNDPCLCGSGLKYKKCCLAKTSNPAPSAVRAESFEIKTDALTPAESKNNFPAVSPEDEELMATLYHNLHEHPDTIDSENCEYFQKLNALHAKYPNNPIILNYITNGYNHLGQQDQVEKLITKTYEKFPDYLFAQTAQANLYLADGFPEKALEVLKGAYTLKQLYPHRTVFHISEVRAFEYFMVRYFCEIGDFEQADLHLQIMQKILEKDDALLRSAQTALKKSKALYSFKARMSHLLSLAKKKI
jgi:tetratricopeptide (TPR) repeat protein